MLTSFRTKKRGDARLRSYEVMRHGLSRFFSVSGVSHGSVK